MTMAKRDKSIPIIEKIQYSFVPNHRDTMEALVLAKLSGREFRVVIAIMNETDGRLREENAISPAYWEKVTGVDSSNIRRLLASLKGFGIVTSRREGRQVLYRVQPPSLWDKSVKNDALKKRQKVRRKRRAKCVENDALLPENPRSERVENDADSEAKQSPLNNSLLEYTPPSSPSSKKCVPAPSQKKGKISSSKKRKTPDPRIKLTMDEMRSYLGFHPKKTATDVRGGEPVPALKKIEAKDPIPSPGKEGYSISRMLDRGYKPEEILACWKAKVDQRREFVSMVWVNEDIGKPRRSEGERLSEVGRDTGKPTGWDGWKNIGDGAEGEAVSDSPGEGGEPEV